MTRYSIIIYASQSQVGEMVPFRCPRCGRIVFRHNAERMVLTNAYGVGIQQLDPGSHATEYKCHSCKTLFRILYQN